jgi:hypothetical protein
VRYGGRVADSSATAARDVPTARVPPVSRRAGALALVAAVLITTAATLCPAAHAGAATVHLTVAHAPTGLVQSQATLDRWHTSPMVKASTQTPTAADAHGTSYLRSVNWAGYFVSGGSGPLRSAQASFVVPKLLSCGPSEDSDSSYWAGLDGSGSQTVEQEGVDSACRNGVVYYIPWYEMYPADATAYDKVVVRGGDSVVATTTYENGGRYVLSLSDSTTNMHEAVTITDPGLENISAECIAEDPGMAPQAPYANYGSVTFSGCMVNGVPIGTLSPDAIDMVNSQGEVDASTTALTDNTSFTVSQVTPAPTPTPPPPTPPPPPVPVASFLLPAVGMASTPSGSGYWLTDGEGAVSTHGGAQYHGSIATVALNSPIAHIVSTSDGNGYWLVAADGGIFAFGDAGFYGSMAGQHLNAPVVDMAPTADDRGYWLVASDGGIFAFGDAAFHGSMGGRPINRPMVGISSDNQTSGYWEVASDGGVFSFDAPFRGSTGALSLNRPIVSMASAADGSGYWFVASDGGIFAFNVPFYGSEGGQPIPAPVVGMAGDAGTGGYWMVGGDGTVYGFNAPDMGPG